MTPWTSSRLATASDASALLRKALHHLILKMQREVLGVLHIET